MGALTGCPAGDVDIFLRMPVERAEDALSKIFEAVQRSQARIKSKRIMVTRSKNAVTFYRVAAKCGAALDRPPVQVRPIMYSSRALAKLRQTHPRRVSL